MSADEKKLIVMTDRYHYTFDAPPTLLQTLKGNFHPYIQASMGSFNVSSTGKTQGQIDLKVVDAPDEALGAAIQAGYMKVGKDVLFSTRLEGERYRAGNVSAPAPYKLNKTYLISVTSEQPDSRTPLTPIQVIGFVPAIAGVTLFALFIELNCAENGTMSNCHE